MFPSKTAKQARRASTLTRTLVTRIEVAREARIATTGEAEYKMLTSVAERSSESPKT